jgi:hypothetical protein
MNEPGKRVKAIAWCPIVVEHPPQVAAGLFVVKNISRRRPCRSLTTWKSMFAASVASV